MSEQRSGVTTLPSREVKSIAQVPLEEFGDTMRIEGVIVGDGGGKRRLLFLPGEYRPAPADTYEMDLDETLAWLRQSDDPTAPEYTDEINGVLKAIVRKSRRQVDQNVAWTCYARDGFECKYCGASDVPLTYDHFLAQAYGGETTVENGVTSCRPCNKRKGHMTIAAWVGHMKERGMKYAEHWANQTKGS